MHESSFQEHLYISVSSSHGFTAEFLLSSVCYITETYYSPPNWTGQILGFDLETKLIENKSQQKWNLASSYKAIPIVSSLPNFTSEAKRLLLNP